MFIKAAAREDAEQALASYWDGQFPVDPFDIAEQMGIHAQSVPLKPNLSGAIIADESGISIFVQEADNFGRQTFTCAHELGHFHERKRKNDLEYSFTEERVPPEELERTRRGEFDPKEFYADEFAANLLMPEEEFRKTFKKYGSDHVAAAKFGVNPAAIRLRRKRLGI